MAPRARMPTGDSSKIGVQLRGFLIVGFCLLSSISSVAGLEERINLDRVAHPVKGARSFGVEVVKYKAVADLYRDRG